ncbi:hypothetical protein GTQ40_04325 [Flavobacteriaceae bacterium R38]|nr:hypothetical protein [Flavobacteriaceae bacterium R38]
MKQICFLAFLLFNLQVNAQSSKIRIAGEIDENLKLDASLTLNSNIPITSDKLKIYNLSAGKNTLNQPAIIINSISAGEEQLRYELDGDWIKLKEVSKIDKLTINYTLSLKDIFDWRKTIGYAMFSSANNKSCWYPDIYIEESREYNKDFEVELIHPEKLKLITSGRPEITKHSNRKNKSFFKADRVRCFALNVGEDFVLETIKIGETEVFYSCPKELAETYDFVANEAVKAISWYIEKYGFFPKKYIGIAMGHKRWGGGFPSENLFYIHRGNLKKDYLQWITSHELGHYFWGYHVLSEEFSPLMLANGIWIDHLYLSEAYGLSLEDTWNTGAHRADMMGRYIESFLSNVEQKIGLTSQEQDELDFDYNSKIAHGKASLGIYLLSREIGFDNFLRIQKELLNKYHNKYLSTQSFIDYCVSEGWDFAETFMNQWSKRNAIIEYDLRNISIEKKNENWHYSFEIYKKGTVDYPIEIEVKDEDQNRYEHKTKAKLGIRKEIISGVSKKKPIIFNLDPKGIVPMWNSSHPAIQRNYILALNRAGHTNVARELAISFLKKFPDDKRVKAIF